MGTRRLSAADLDAIRSIAKQRGKIITTLG
jgi:hypothetical protein